MKCNHCGAENNEGAKFCSNCGTPIQIEKEANTSVTVSSESTKPVQEQTASAKNETTKIFKPTTLIGLTLSGIAFIAGLVLYSLMIEKEFLIYGPDTLVFIPAFAGLALSINALLQSKDLKSKIVNITSVSIAGFAIFYGFLTYCICLG